MSRKYSLVLFPALALCSFMVVGPPGSPPLQNYGSASEALETNIRYRTLFTETDDVTSDITSNITEANNYTSPLVNNRIINGGSYFWLGDEQLMKHNKMPYAPPGYTVWRDVSKPPYNARGDGKTDDWKAISKAIQDSVPGDERCGGQCNATSTKGAVIYFPGNRIYRISQPLVQYYYTAFIGDVDNKPVIKPMKGFKGIALIDTDFYIPGKSGAEWWVNQNNFYRQIRNFVLDMREMDDYVTGGPTNHQETSLPVGIHWQVSQACTLQNIDFKLKPGKRSRGVGIFQENGSGGFVSDLTFDGGKYCWMAGSQQYTARNIKFNNCQTAIWMIWDWGWNWKDIEVTNSKVAIDATDMSDKPDNDTGRYQGTASLTIQDSKFINVGEILRVNVKPKFRPAVVIDNIDSGSTKKVVQEMGGKTLYSGGHKTWAMGIRVTDDHEEGKDLDGPLTPEPVRPTDMVNEHGSHAGRSKPQYNDRGPEGFANVLTWGVSNEAKNPASNRIKINQALKETANSGQVLVFPSGIYLVDDTILFPRGSRVVGVMWSQIMATGVKFSDPQRPHVLAMVGEGGSHEGEKGVVEISDMMFTVKGNTAGAVLMDWNVHEESQASAAMWDVIFRVGGAMGSELTLKECPWSQKLRPNDKCMAGHLMLHVRPKSSIYMENMWFWVADHDIDDPSQDRVNVYNARGVLIRSKGPSWIYGTSNEHSTLYNWQFLGAENVYLGHIQSESPYFHAARLLAPADTPYPPGIGKFPSDPMFDHCDGKENPKTANGLDTCKVAWAMRIVASRNIFLYGGGFYSFFNDYNDTCAKTGKVCQRDLIDTDYSDDIYLNGLYTVGAERMVNPQGDRYKPYDHKPAINGFATAVSAWLLLAGPDKSWIGGTRKSQGWKSAKSIHSGSKAQGQHDRPKRDCDALAKELKGWDGKNHTCKDDAVNSRFDEDQDKLWTRSGAPVMWCRLMERLETEYQRGERSFAKFVDPNSGLFFGNTTPTKEIAWMLNDNSAKDWTCGLSPGTKCQAPGPMCEDVALSATDNRAAAGLILNSLINLSEWYKLIKEAFEYTFNHIRQAANSLRVDFAPTHLDKEPEWMQAVKLMADVAQVAVFLPNAAIWYRGIFTEVRAQQAIVRTELEKALPAARTAAFQKEFDSQMVKTEQQYLAYMGYGPSHVWTTEERTAQRAQASAAAQAQMPKLESEIVAKNTHEVQTIMNKADQFKGSMDTMLFASFSIYKDHLGTSDKDIIDKTGARTSNVSAIMETITRALQQNMEDRSNGVFGGYQTVDQDYLRELDAMIKTGAFARREKAQKEVKTIKYSEDFLQPLILGPAIEETWKLDHGYWPVIITQEDYFKSDREYEEWRRTMQSKAPPNQCVWPVEEAPEEPLVCVAHLAEATIRFEHKLYYIMGHRDCPKGHFMEQDEMDNDGQSCMPSDDGGFSECPRMPLTTGRKLKFCKGGPTSDDRYGLVKLNGVERLSTPLNPYKITIEDIVISSVRTRSEVNMRGDDGKERDYATAMSDYLTSRFPDEKLGNMTEAEWRRAPGLFRVPSCDWATWRWNYENWSLSKSPSKDAKCAAFPCCPAPSKPEVKEKARKEVRNRNQGRHRRVEV